MRAFPLIILAFVANTSQALTVISIANGPWNDPSTWDCNCVPGFTNNVLVITDVTVEGTVVFGQPQVRVASSGQITMAEAGSVAMVGAVFINDGHVQFFGQSTITGLFNNTGLAEFTGQLTNDGTMEIEAGSVHVQGSFSNFSALSGAGGICVAAGTVNGGTISGTLDFCDWTPTTDIPPIIDQNTGTVEGTVTFCAFGLCATGVEEFAGVQVMAWADAGELEIMGIPTGGAEVLLIDALGRTVVRTNIPQGSMRLSLPQLATGLCRVVMSNGQGRRVLPVLLTR